MTPAIQRLLLQHFPLFLIGVVALNAALAALRVSGSTTNDSTARADAVRLVWQLTAALVALFAALEVLGFTSQLSPLCFLPLPWATGWRLGAAATLWFGWVGGVVYWVFRGGGATRLGRNAALLIPSAAPPEGYSVRAVQDRVGWWAIGMIAMPIAFFFFVPRNERAPVQCSAGVAPADARSESAAAERTR